MNDLPLCISIEHEVAGDDFFLVHHFVSIIFLNQF